MIKIILYVIFVFGSMLMTNIAHEFVHKAIYDLYNIPSKIKHDKKGFKTEADLTYKELKEVRQLHAITEIMGYPLILFTAIMCVGFGFVIFGG